MRYAKLIDNQIQFSPNPIHIGTRWRINPPGSVYEAEGYKPATYTDPPGEPDAGYQWVETWSETENAIVQGWEQIPVPDDVSADEAMDILFGGEGE